MSHKQLFFRASAREKILRGATVLADGVRVTLGPKPKCVLIEKKWSKPIVCNDGVTIAKEIELENAVSVASVLLLTEATMTEVPEQKAEAAPDLGLTGA